MSIFKSEGDFDRGQAAATGRSKKGGWQTSGLNSQSFSPARFSHELAGRSGLLEPFPAKGERCARFHRFDQGYKSEGLPGSRRRLTHDSLRLVPLNLFQLVSCKAHV